MVASKAWLSAGIWFGLCSSGYFPCPEQRERRRAGRGGGAQPLSFATPSVQIRKFRKSQLGTSKLSEMQMVFRLQPPSGERAPGHSPSREKWSLGNALVQRDFCSQAAHKCVVAEAIGCTCLLLFIGRCWSKSVLKPRLSAPCTLIVLDLQPPLAHLHSANPTLLLFKRQFWRPAWECEPQTQQDWSEYK